LVSIRKNLKSPKTNLKLFMTNELAETNLTPQSEPPLAKSEANQTPASQNNCQGYQA
jgi:hypothetical protein